MSQQNERVFRRNIKNVILLWSSRHLTDDQRENIRVYAVEANDYRELTWRPFVPDNPDKFSPDVVGVVIGHSNNKLDSSEPCVIRIMLGTGDGVIEMEKDVQPASTAGPADPPVRPQASPAAPAAAERTINVRLYAQAANGDWVPVQAKVLPALDILGPILLKESD